MTMRTRCLCLAPVVLALVSATAAAQSAAENQADAERLIAALHVAAGSTVCEIGAGGGELTVLIAKAVGPDGHVYSNDLNADRRREIGKAVKDAALTNVTVVEGKPDSANIAPGTCDGVFMRNVYHHFADPATMNTDLFRALKPGGAVAVIDFTPRGTESADPKGRADEAHHGVSPASVMRELQAAGFAALQSSSSGQGFIVSGVRPR